MRAKTKRKLTYVIAAIFPVAGLAILGWAVIAPADVDIQKENMESAVRKAIPLPNAANLDQLTLRRLRNDLNPKPKVAVKQKATAALQWPTIKLDCILIGSNTRIAVFQANSTVFRVMEGESVSGISVNKINNESVDVSYRGEKRNVRLAKAQEERP